MFPYSRNNSCKRSWKREDDDERAAGQDDDERGDSFAVRSLPGMARSNLDLRSVPIVLAHPAALESGDSFTDRSPPGMV